MEDLDDVLDVELECGFESELAIPCRTFGAKLSSWGIPSTITRRFIGEFGLVDLSLVYGWLKFAPFMLASFHSIPDNGLNLVIPQAPVSMEAK